MGGGHELLAKKIDDLDKKCATGDSKIRYDVKRHISSTPEMKKLQAPGWYRVFEFNSYNTNDALGALSWLPTFTIFRGYWSNDNEVHQIQLIGKHKSHSFINENSKSGSLIIPKIRLVANSKNAFVDVYYSASIVNQIIGSVMNSISAKQDVYWSAIPDPYMVDETTDGETVLATHDFQKNYTIESRLAALEAALASTASTTSEETE